MKHLKKFSQLNKKDDSEKSFFTKARKEDRPTKPKRKDFIIPRRRGGVHLKPNRNQTQNPADYTGKVMHPNNPNSGAT